MNFTNSIKAIFNDRRLVYKAGLIFGLYVISEIVSLGIGTLVDLSSFFSSMVKSSSVLTLMTTSVSFIGPMVIFPVLIYAMGYMYRTADAVRKQSGGDLLPEHTDIKRTFTLGSVYFGEYYTFNFIFSIIIILAIVAGMFIFSRDSIAPDSSTFSILLISLIVGLVVVILLTAIVMFFVNTFVVPSMMYIYLKKNSFALTFSFKAVSAVIVQAWQEWLLYYLFTALLAFLTLALKILVCCVPVFVPAFIETLDLLCSAGILGSIYSELDQKISDEVLV